jgi:hypothetical protein
MPTFEVLINDCFANLSTDSTLEPVDNKYILSLINDFEDGKWRSSKFHQFIWNNVAQTALSAEERESLVNDNLSILIRSAENLRLTDQDKEECENIGRGSELAEILLYGIMKEYYGALPVVPKIFYKQSTKDNAKGADSVHIVVKDEDYTIWFGEAKFYNSFDDARFDTIIKSVATTLQTDKLKKENSIIVGVKDMDKLIQNENIRKRIKNDLNNKNSIDELKPRLHIPILILHECNITRNQKILNDDYKEQIINYHKERVEAYFKKHIAKLKSTINLYEKITFHLILFPVPCKKDIVDKFVRRVEFEKEEAIND